MKQIFKARASGLSKIMGKTGLGETGLKHLDEYMKERDFKRRKELKMKYLTKGNRNEEEGFTMLAVHRDLGMVYKNEDHFENDFLKGTPDLILPDAVWDNKASWDIFTFPMYMQEVKVNSVYWWQMQAYMWLVQRKKAVLGFTLSNADHELINNEIRWLKTDEEKANRINDMVFTRDAWEAAIKEFCNGIEYIEFIEIPEEKRVKTFDIDFDPKIIPLVSARVIECRKITDQ